MTLEELRRRVDEMAFPAKLILEEAGLPTDDPDETLRHVAGDNHCLLAAAYLRARAACLYRYIETGDLVQACAAAMDVEYYWHELVILDHVAPYGRRRPTDDLRSGRYRSTDETYVRDMAAGASSRAGARGGGKAGKRKAWAEDLAERLAGLDRDQAWASIPTGPACIELDQDTQVCRDGDKIIAFDTVTEHEIGSMSQRNFLDRYHRPARRNAQ